MESVADPKNIEARVNRSREAVASAIEVIANTRPSVRPKSSPIMALLEPHAEVIRKALSDGWTAGAIARALHAKGVSFAEDSIRLRIAASFSKGAEAQPSDKPKRERASGTQVVERQISRPALQQRPPAPPLSRPTFDPTEEMEP